MDLSPEDHATLAAAAQTLNPPAATVDGHCARCTSTRVEAQANMMLGITTYWCADCGAPIPKQEAPACP